jgi:hypothetical protein
MLGSAGVRTLSYGGPVNWAAPLNLGLTYWWRVLPLRTGGNTWVDLVRQKTAAMAGMLPASSVIGFGPPTRPGASGELRFNGTSSTVLTGLTPTQLGMTTTTKAVAVWVKPLGTAPVVSFPYQGAVVFGDSGETFMLVRSNYSSTDRIWAYGWNTTDFWVGVVYTAGVWTHWTYVHTGGNILLYKNGVQAGTVAVASVDGMANPVGIGCRTATLNFFQGVIDDVRFYNRAPSASEIKALYQSSLRGYPQELNWQTYPPAFTRTAAAGGRTTKNTRSFMLGMMHGMERRLGMGRLG